jgi:RNA polymerase sigma-70 factor (ECF subfamily)
MSDERLGRPIFAAPRFPGGLGLGRLADASDEEVLTLVASGSEVAFRTIWERYGAAVFSLCLRRLSDRGSAEDATQEAFTNVWKRAATFDPGRGSAAGWLYAVARNAAAQEGRHHRRDAVPVAVLDESHASDEEEAVTRLAVHAALTRIPATERDVLELAYFDDLSHSQVADRLSLPLGTVKTRIRSGLVRLQQYLEGARP